MSNKPAFIKASKSRTKTGLSEVKSYEVVKGAYFDTQIVVSYYGLCVAAVHSLENLDCIFDDLKSMMTATESPSGSICFSADCSFHVHDNVRRSYASNGISFVRSAKPDALAGAIAKVESYNSRLADDLKAALRAEKPII